MSKKYKIIIGIVVGIAAVVITVSIVYVSWFILSAGGVIPGFDKTETNPKNYLKVDNHFYMELCMFPKKVDEKRVIEYKYHPITGLFDDYEYLYLKYQYKKEEYKKEKERLSKIQTEFTETKLDYRWLGKPVYVLYFNYLEYTSVAICNDDKNIMEYLYVQFPDEYHEKYIKELKEDLTYNNRYDNSTETMPLGKPNSEIGRYVEKIENKNRKVEKIDFVKVNGVKYVEAYVAKKDKENDGYYEGRGDTILWNIEKEKESYRFKYTFDDEEEDLFEKDIKKYKLNKERYQDKIYDLCFIYKRKYLDSSYKDINKDGYQDAIFTGTKQLFNVREGEGVEEEFPIKKVFIYNKKSDKFIYDKRFSVD